MSFKERLEKFGSTYWVVALIAAKDLYDIAVGIFTADVSFMEILRPIEWVDLLIRLLFAFGVVQIFRYYRSMKGELAKIKEDLEKDKAELGDAMALMAVINSMRMQKDFERYVKPRDEGVKAEMLQENIEHEKKWLRQVVPQLYPDRTTAYWHEMIEEAYPVGYLVENTSENDKKGNND